MNRELHQAIDYDLHKVRAQKLREEEFDRLFDSFGVWIAGLGKTRAARPAPRTVTRSPHASHC